MNAEPRKMGATDADFHEPSYETGYGEGESSMFADYVIALDDVWPEERDEPYPSAVAAYIAELRESVRTKQAAAWADGYNSSFADEGTHWLGLRTNPFAEPPS